MQNHIKTAHTYGVQQALKKFGYKHASELQQDLEALGLVEKQASRIPGHIGAALGTLAGAAGGYVGGNALGDRLGGRMSHSLGGYLGGALGGGLGAAAGGGLGDLAGLRADEQGTAATKRMAVGAGIGAGAVLGRRMSLRGNSGLLAGTPDPSLLTSAPAPLEYADIVG